jgi:hypothetical protein
MNQQIMPTDETFQSNGLLIEVNNQSDYNAVIQLLWHGFLACWVNGQALAHHSPMEKEGAQFPFYVQVYAKSTKRGYTVGWTDNEGAEREIKFNQRKMVTTEEFFNQITK